MKLVLKRLLLFIISSSILCTGFISANAINDSDAFTVEDSLIEAYNHILSSFERDSNNQYVYPDEYAGAYIEDLKLYICVTHLNDNIKNNYFSSAKTTNNIEFVVKPYSLNDLNILISQIETSNIDNISTICVIQKNNSIRIGTSNTDINSFEKQLLSSFPAPSRNQIQAKTLPIEIVYSPQLNLELPDKQDSTIVPTALPSLVGGIKLSLSDGSYFSLGLCGKYNGKPAILTCGHMQTVGSSVYVNSQKIGTFVKVNWPTSGYYDYGIIELTSAASQFSTNKVKTASSTQAITSTNYSSVEGMSIQRYGCRTGYGTGTVSATNMSVTYGGHLIHGLVEVGTTTSINSGDSGGSVYSGNKFYGVIKGHNGSNLFYYSPSGVVSGFSV